MSEHALLSPSASSRWVSCPGSVKASETFPDHRSAFAEEGTAAHELCERCLTKEVSADNYLGQTINGFEVNQEMVDSVNLYLDYVRSI